MQTKVRIWLHGTADSLRRSIAQLPEQDKLLAELGEWFNNEGDSIALEFDPIAGALRVVPLEEMRAKYRQ